MIVKSNLSEQIYEAIMQDIINQNIGFGEKLTNRELQEKYGVSSTPVRDAINRLYLDGLLEHISNGGARVISYDYKMAIEVNEVISVLSREALAMSAERGDQGKIIPLLEQALLMQREHIAEDTYYEHDCHFHGIFFDFCDNSHISKIYAQHSVLWMILIRFYYRDENSTRDKAIAQHEQILAAYKQGDIGLAQRFMRHHYQCAVNPFSKTLQKTGATV